MRILAIDPGTVKSAWVIWDTDNEKLIQFDIQDNQQVLNNIYLQRPLDGVICEMIASYGMPVGKEVFETVLWIGRFMEAAITGDDLTWNLVYRKDVKMHLCNSMKANDASIRQALIDRFGAPGTKKVPGTTYGIKKDLWSALAIAVTWHDLHQYSNK